MARWRFLLPWSEDELKRELARLSSLPLNFSEAPEDMTEANGWIIDGSNASLGHETSGPPLDDDLFQRAKQALKNYDFSDPLIVTGHFDPRASFIGRTMLLEIKVLGLRYLTGVRVQNVRQESTEKHTIFGFRYDTIEGHIEKGAEWFLLTKNHQTGEVWFRIEAHWQTGAFPNWWSHVGFLLIGQRFRVLWRNRAPMRLKKLAHQPIEEALAAPGELAHRGNVIPKRSR